MSHTPAPWHDDGYRIYGPTGHDDKRNGRMIVEYKHVEDFNPDDAPLIATAPELLVALKALADGGVIGGHDHPTDICRCGNCQIRRLIARAEGKR